MGMERTACDECVAHRHRHSVPQRQPGEGSVSLATLPLIFEVYIAFDTW